MFKRVRGTQDVLPPDTFSWQEIEENARRIFCFYGYQEIRVPILEKASLFNHSLGETTEIVQKQMFEIRQGDDHLVLRPEGTASVVRAYLENNLDKSKVVSKLYYLGPMFRAERPQKGRLRQFHHLGVEAIGSLSAYLDVEVISLADRLLREFGISDYQILINSLGCLKDKSQLASQLRNRLKGHLPKLCSDCQNRFKRNIFRILDCKNSGCKKVVDNLDLNQDYLCRDCNDHFKRVTAQLQAINIKFELLPSLVRGLDYYTRTVFEIKHQRLGAQDALAAGGRYDHLVAQLGGKESGAMGFAFGIERLLLAKDAKPVSANPIYVYIIVVAEVAREKAGQLLHTLRQNNISADMDVRNKKMNVKKVYFHP